MAGRLTVRHGPRTTSVASNLVSACGYLGYLFVHDLPLLFVTVFVVMAGDRMYFAAWPTLVAEVAGADELEPGMRCSRRPARAVSGWEP